MQELKGERGNAESEVLDEGDVAGNVGSISTSLSLSTRIKKSST